MAPTRTNQAWTPIDKRSFLRAQQCLYFLPLPQGHGSLRPGWLLTALPLLRPYSKQRKRVDAGIDEPHAPVEVGPRHAPRRPGEAELLALLHYFTNGNVAPRQVQVGREEAVAVVDVNGVTAEEQVLREHYAAAVRRVDRRACGGAQIRPGMRRSRLAVEYTAMAEVAAVLRAADRHLERLAPIALRRERVVDRARLGGLAVRARLVLGRQLDEALFDLQLRRRILARIDQDGLAHDAHAAVVVRECDVDCVVAGPRI